jgi:protein involved in polysaccharide export with SLBB domain
MILRPLSLIALAACAAFVSPGATAAQELNQSLSHRLLATRSDLERHLGALRDLALTPKRGGLSAEALRAETTYVQQRLTQGDFRVGDQLQIIVEDPGPVPGAVGGGAAVPATVEQQLSDTFTVGSNRDLTLPEVGVVSLRGVLRAELESFLTAQIARTVRDPVVHAHALISLAVSGGVLKPGYYLVPANAVLPAVITAAGGASARGELTKAMIKRGPDTFVDAKKVREAVAEGRTIDDLDLRPGDEIMVPEKSGTGAREAIGFTAMLLTIPITLYTLGQIFSH